MKSMNVCTAFIRMIPFTIFPNVTIRDPRIGFKHPLDRAVKRPLLFFLKNSLDSKSRLKYG